MWEIDLGPPVRLAATLQPDATTSGLADYHAGLAAGLLNADIASSPVRQAGFLAEFGDRPRREPRPRAAALAKVGSAVAGSVVVGDVVGEG